MNLSLRRPLSRLTLVVTSAMLPAPAPAAEAETDPAEPSVSGEIDVVYVGLDREWAFEGGGAVGRL